MSLVSTRYAAVLAAALSLGACSGSPQSGGVSSSPAVLPPASSLASAPDTRGVLSPLQSLRPTRMTSAFGRRPHGMPADCNPVIVDKTDNVVSFKYNVKAGAGSYELVWNSPGGVIDTIIPFFEFYNAPPTNTRFDSFSGPNQNPTWLNYPTGWQGTDIQPDYWPAGTYEMKWTIEGSISGKTLASVLVKCS